MPYETLPPSAQSAYADLHDSLIGTPPPHRGISVFTRTLKQRRYWYLQSVIGERKQSFYLGPDNETTRHWIESAKARLRNDQGARPTRERIVATGVAAGLWAPNTGEARVYEALSQSGLFAIGGVLVGSHAFLNIGNLLCVRWHGGMSRTEDIDVAHDPVFTAVAPNAGEDLLATLKTREPDFIPVPTLDPRHPSTTFRIRRKQLSVSLLTPERGQPGRGPVRIEALKATAEPVRYLDYLIEACHVAAVPSGAGILIRVPDPARFALHKLVVAQRRPAAMTAKVRKDVEQATALLTVIREVRPGDLALAFEAAVGMGGKFIDILRSQLDRLPATLRDWARSSFSG